MNKILVSIYVPMLEEEYELLIPINQKIGTIKRNIISAINELSYYSIDNIESLAIYEKQTGLLCQDNQYVYNSIIKNGTQLLLV